MVGLHYTPTFSLFSFIFIILHISGFYKEIPRWTHGFKLSFWMGKLVPRPGGFLLYRGTRIRFEQNAYKGVTWHHQWCFWMG
ncbi:hypothetical protein V8F33_013605 [Rhypophila sp. PSN 637]